jgi:transposase
MRRFVEGIDRGQATLFPECLEDWIDADNSVRMIDAFVEKLDLSGLGFDGVAPEATGRPPYHPAVLLKLYIYGYLNRVQSSRHFATRGSGDALPRCRGRILRVKKNHGE